MSAGSNLQGGGGLTLEQRIANIEAALRGGPPVIDALGVPTDDDVDLGSALNAWRDVFANGLVVGGARVDIAALAGSAPIYVFDASDATFAWPGTQTTALMLLWSSASGGGGGGGGGYRRGTDGARRGANGGGWVRHPPSPLAGRRIQAARPVGGRRGTGGGFGPGGVDFRRAIATFINPRRRGWPGWPPAAAASAVTAKAAQAAVAH